jgi:hypothetical protein
MKRYLLFLLLVLSAAHANAGPQPPAQQEADIPYWGVAPNVLPERLALIVGVEYYDEPDRFQLPQLKGATQDANDIAKLVQKLGVKKDEDKDKNNLFLLATDGVTKKRVTRDEIDDAVTKLRERAQKVAADTKRKPIVIFYYAGHGINYEGKNLLVPSGFKPSATDLILKQSIDLGQDIVRRLVNDASLLVVIVDACRSPAPPFENVRVGVYMPDQQVRKEQKERLSSMRVAFLFATLEGEPSVEIAGIGGRFTTQLIGAVERAFKFSRENPNERIVHSLHDIFTSASDGMSLQIPDWREIRAGGFYPFPTIGAYQFAEEFYSKALTQNAHNQLMDPGTIEGYKAEICNILGYLKNFSYHSYFAPGAINRMDYLKNGLARQQGRDVDVETMCSQRGDLASPEKAPVRSFAYASQSNRYTELIPAEPWPAQNESVRFAQATDVKSDAPTPARVGSPPIEQETGAPQNDAAGELAPVLPKEGPALPVSPTVTVGDVREATAPHEVAVSQLDANVPLDRAVVARTSLNIRAAPSASAPVLTAVREGELLEVVEADSMKGWLKVRHPQTTSRTGAGFVDATFVRPALTKLSKLITFEKAEYGVTEAARTDLVTTFALVGGVAISEAVVEYPRATGPLGFARAASVADFLQERSAAGSTKERAGLVVRIREDQGNEKMAMPEDAVRLTITALALDQGSRATLANNPTPQEPVVLDIAQRPQKDKNSPTAVDLKLCSADATQCGTTAPSVTRGVKSAVQDALREAGKSLDTLQKLAPMIKF